MRKLLDKESGQTLIEMLIAIAVGTLIVASILGLATRASRNANSARTAGQASKLAQQGMEIVRNIRSVDEPGYILNPPLFCLTCDQWSDLYGVDFPLGSTTFVLVKPGPPGACGPLSWCLSDNSPGPETIVNDNQNFSRIVNIRDDGTDCTSNLTYAESKEVTVRVSWTDPAGPHEINVVSCINNRI